MAQSGKFVMPTKMEVDNSKDVAYRTDDGTVYHWKNSAPEKLYVNWQGKEVSLDICDRIQTICAQGHWIYFITNKQMIYRAVFIPSSSIKVSYFRKMLKEEEIYPDGMITRMNNGRKYVYKLGDDPNNFLEAVQVEAFEEDIRHFKLIGIHRKKALLLALSNVHVEPVVRQWGKNVIKIYARHHKYSRAFAHDSSRYIYITLRDKMLHTLDSETMEFLPPLQFESVTDICRITCVNNGEITADVKSGGGISYSMTAQLPRGYYEQTKNGQAELVLMEKNDERKNGNEFGKKRNDQAEKEVMQKIAKRDKGNEITTVANNTFDKLLDQCCCFICSENFDSEKIIPRNLDCGHTFCEGCLYNERMRIGNNVKCPNCASITPLPNGKTLPKNFTVIGLAEELMKSRVDPRVACKACGIKFSSSSVCMCTKEDCSMYNELICLNCTIDGGHGGHVVKYDVKMEKIRKDLRVEVDDLCKLVQEKKTCVLDKADQLKELFKSIETNLTEAEIPSQVLGQLDKLVSEQEASEYKEIVYDLAKTIIDQCDSLIESFESSLNCANGLDLLGDNITMKGANEE